MNTAVSRKSKGKRPLGRHKHKWENILKCVIEKQRVAVWTELTWLRMA
jgi:hypothetical protein